MNQIHKKYHSFISILFWATIFIAFCLRLYGVWIWDLSYSDEYHTYFDSLEQPGHRGIFSIYYYVTHYSLLIFGVDSVLALRLPAVIIALITIPVFYQLVKIVFGKRIAVFSVSLLAFSVWHVEMSQYARYYSAVFLLAAIHQFSFLRFLQTHKTSHILISLIFGLLAFLMHAAAIFIFIPMVIYCLLALKKQPGWVSGISKKVLLAIIVSSTVIALISSTYLFEILSLWLNKSSLNSYGNAWALIPLLALNQYSLPLFIGCYLGVLGLMEQNKFPEFLYVLLVLICTPIIIIAFSTLMNFSVQYVFCFAPVFMVSAGVLCNQVYSASSSSSALLSYSVLIILITSQLPGLISYFQERHAISHDDAYAFIVEQSKPNSILLTNMGLGLVDVSNLEVIRSKKPPRNRNFNWQDYLDKFKASKSEVWFAWKVSRIGLAPKLQDWLIQNTELIYEKKANRIDRRARSLTVWRLKTTVHN